MASVTSDWQHKTVFVSVLRLGEHLLEALTQVLELNRVTKVALQDAGSDLVIINLFEGGSIQIILEFLWAKRSIGGCGRLRYSLAHAA